MARLESHPWIKSASVSFFATVLGIVLTLGTSKLMEIKNNRAMQRQCVFNVLSDIDNARHYFRKDSALVAELGQWLPDYMERHATHQEYPKDSAFTRFWDTAYTPLYQQHRYIPVGRTIMSAIVPVNEDDMALHRTMELAFTHIDRIQSISDRMHERVEYMRLLRARMCYDTKELTENGVVESFMNDDDMKLLAEMVYQLDRGMVYGTLLEWLQTYYDTILKMSGMTKEDHDAYLEKVTKRQGQ